MKHIITIALFLISTSALADHQGWSGWRGSSYSNSFQFITESEYIHSDTKFETTRVDEQGVESVETSSRVYKGLGLKTSLGTELVRFVRFSVYHLYRDLSHNPSTSLRGSEVGGETKLNFYGPVVNLQLGLGLDVSRLNHQSIDGSTMYFGSGYTGSVGIERFIAPKASVVFTVKAQQENLKPEESAVKTRAHSSNVGAGLALILWLD